MNTKKLSFEELERVDGGETAAQFVISCTESAYRDNGYIGLGAFIGSFFMPEIALGIAASCYGHYLGRKLMEV